MPADRETRAMMAGKWLLAAVVPGSAMAIGSLHTTTLIVVSLLAAASCVLLWLEPPRRTSRASRWVLVAFAILMGATILQAIPLPAGLVSVIAPANADVWARALTPLHEPGPSWHPISVAPPATHLEILKGALYGCVFLAALRMTFIDGGSRFLEAVVIASACLLAVTTLAHTAVEAEQVFGFYQPRDAQGYFAHRIGPLLNPNHVAAYCNVGALVAVGVALSDRGGTARVLGIGASVLLSGTSVWAGSRGGTASLVVGAMLVLGLALYRRGRRRTAGVGQVEAVVVLVALLAAGALVGISASDVAREDLGGHDLTKFQIVRMALHLVPLSPLFGFGRGAFETMFPVVREGTTYFTFIRAENIVAQWTTEWGVPLALAGLAALAVALRPSVVLRSERPAIGSWVAVVAAALHDLVDFHLEVPGVLVLVAVCVAIVVGGRAASAERRAERPRGSVPRRVAFAAAGFAVLAIAIISPAVGHSLADDRDAVAKLAIDPEVTAEAFGSDVRAMMLRYPAEPFFPLAGAIRAQATGEGGVVPWIARALERYPTFGRAHLVLARSLARRNRAQARLEYRLAYQWDTLLRGNVSTEGQRLVGDYDSAMDLVPDGAAGTELIESLSTGVGARLPATSVRLDEELLRRDPNATGPLKRRIEAVTADLRFEHPWCTDKAACAAPAIAAARALVVGPEGSRCEAHVLLAKIRIAAGETSAALDELSRAADVTTDRAACLQALVQLSLDTGDKRRADQAIDRTLRSGCGDVGECSRLYTWAAGTVQARGNNVKAIALYKRAAEVDPAAEGQLAQAGELAAQAGLYTEAIDIFERLARRQPDEPRWRARANELRVKARERQPLLP